MESSTVKMEGLIDAIKYFGDGWEYFRLFVIEDEKGKEYKEYRHRILCMDSLEEDMARELNDVEEKRYAVFFYPNGIATDALVKEIRWFFVDIDKGDYKEQWERIEAAPLKPTIIYKGRAGHKLLYRVREAYWDNSSVDAKKDSIVMFNNTEQQLVEFFGGDGNVISPGNALRLPFVKNYKEFPKVYTEEIVYFNPENVYTQQMLIDAFPPSKKRHKACEGISFSEYPEKLQEIVDELTMQFDLQGIEYKFYLNQEGKKRIAFSCPVHEDETPSAYMFLDKLYVHCSRGGADGSCEIENGKSLGWLAERMGWFELKKLYEELIAVKEAKYRDITLQSMSNVNEVTFITDYGKHIHVVEGVLEIIRRMMNDRGLQIDSDMELMYNNMTYSALEYMGGNPLVVPVIPGGGKSTWMEAFAEWHIKNDLTNAGIIIAVERIETAKRLQKVLGSYSMLMDIDGVDIAGWRECEAAFVMESAFTSEYCHKELTEYEYGVCRNCDRRKTCKTAKQYHLQKERPIVIVSHSRMQMDKDKLDKYSTWTDAKGIEHKRRLVIADEKLPLTPIQVLTLKQVFEFDGELFSMYLDIPEYEAVKVMVERVKECFKQVGSNGKLLPIDTEYRFGFKHIWYRKYNGKNANIIEQIERLIREGGLWGKDVSGKVTVTTYHKNSFTSDALNVIMLDGTSWIDLEYTHNEDAFDFLQMISSNEAMGNLTFNIADVSLGKDTLNRNDTHIKFMVNEIKEIAKTGKTLVICHNDFEEEYKELLEEEIKAGVVFVNHYNNLKGSNDYNQCINVVFAGTLHKGDVYYAAKHDALYGGVDSFNAITINDVRRFDNVGIEKTKLNDQLVTIIQDICRTALRNKGNTQHINVYLPTKDKIFIGIIKEYFEGADVQEWRIDGITKLPEWYGTVDHLFDSVKREEKFKKILVMVALGLQSDSDKRKFRRLQNTPFYRELMKKHSIEDYNGQAYIKRIA